MRRDVAVALTGGVLLVATGVALLLLRPDPWPQLGTVGAELAGGREVAIPTAFSLGLPAPEAAATVLLVEWSMLLLGFPLLVLAGDRLARIPRVEALFHRARERAQAHPNTGVLALGALTLFPFLPVGALTSVLIGEFLGLPARRLVPTLMAAEVLAIVTVTASVYALLPLLPDPRLAAGLMAALLLLAALVGGLLGRRRRGTSHK